MLGNTNAGLDSRFAQFQGQPGAAAAAGYPGLGGNMQALQSLQAGSFGLQNPLQAGGRPGLGGLQGGAGAGGALGAQQRLGAAGGGLAPSLQQLGLGQAGPGARVAVPGQQFAGVNGERCGGAAGRGRGRALDGHGPVPLAALQARSCVATRRRQAAASAGCMLPCPSRLPCHLALHASSNAKPPAAVPQGWRARGRGWAVAAWPA